MTQIIVNLPWVQSTKDDVSSTTRPDRMRPTRPMSSPSTASPDVDSGATDFMQKWDERRGDLGDYLQGVEDLLQAIYDAFNTTEQALAEATRTAVLMTTWQTIFGVDAADPGLLSEFAAARDTFETMRADAQNVVDQFANFSDPSFVEEQPQRRPGALLTQMLQHGRRRPRTYCPASPARRSGIFSDHYDRLVELRDEADGALGRARTAWDRKNELVGQQSSLQSQIDGLNSQIDDAADDADTTGLDYDLSGAAVVARLASTASSTRVQGTLDGIYGNDDSEYNDLRQRRAQPQRRHRRRAQRHRSRCSRGPRFLGQGRRRPRSVADFLGGILESLANLVEAFVTGDWATFFWELKNLLDVGAPDPRHDRPVHRHRRPARRCC